MDFVDIFCGIGTIRMGMEKAGHKCIYSIEWDKNKRAIYKAIFGEEPSGGDISYVQSIPETIIQKVSELGISKTRLCMAAGDACTVNVIYEIAK